MFRCCWELGSALFTPATDYETGDGPTSVAIGDLDGDAVPDLALANNYGDDLSLLVGNGDGSFQAKVDFEDIYQPYSVAIDDLNGDGNLDLAVANHHGGHNLWVLLGNGDGTFETFMIYTACYASYSIAIGDLTGDGHPDLAVASIGFSTIEVLMGNGDGTFQPAMHHGTGDYPYSVAIGDLDGDSKPDLAVANYIGDNVSVLINTGVPAWETVSAGLACLPSTGALPFTTRMYVFLSNIHPQNRRRVAATMNITLGGGGHIANWRSGYTNIDEEDTYSISWIQTIPDIGKLVGDNIFTLVAADVTPAPYNQPPYPPAGFTDSRFCTVTGIAP